MKYVAIAIQQFKNEPIVSQYKNHVKQNKTENKKMHYTWNIECVRKTCKQFEYPNYICNAAFRRMNDQKIVTIFSRSSYYFTQRM